MQLPQPFFRKFDGWWYVQIRQDGKRRQIKLAQGRENRKLALERYWALMSQEDIALAADHIRLNFTSFFRRFPRLVRETQRPENLLLVQTLPAGLLQIPSVTGSYGTQTLSPHPLDLPHADNDRRHPKPYRETSGRAFVPK